MLDATDRKKIAVLIKYASNHFSPGDWSTLGRLTGTTSVVDDHPRLLRALSFGDDDYGACAAEVLDRVFQERPETIDDVVDYFDVDLWYEQQAPEKAASVFRRSIQRSSQIWKPQYLRLFMSHLVKSKKGASRLKLALEAWGISSFVAHEDIEPTKEWQVEIESALRSMDLLAALIEPGFDQSRWTDQEIGFALGLGVDVVPIRVGMDPYGFVGKIQGVQAKGKLATEIGAEIAILLIRKPRYRAKLLPALSLALARQSSADRVSRIRSVAGELDAGELRTLLERSGLVEADKHELAEHIARSGAFEEASPDSEDDEIPF